MKSIYELTENIDKLNFIFQKNKFRVQSEINFFINT